MSHTVVVDAVAKRFGRNHALDGVSLDLATGVTGLLGPNGAGKTTLLRMLATVLVPDTGSLRLLGRDPADPDDRLAIRRRLGYFPQEPGFFRGFTVFEFVDYVAILKEMTDARRRHDEVRRVVAEVGLEQVSGKKIRALSGGMRRRVALAQSLLGDPELLVLDEPTVGLDPEQRLRFRDVVSRVGEGRTVVLSTHQTEDVAALCHRVLVIDRGRIFFDGTAASLAALAAGRVWVADARSGDAQVAWRNGNGRYRNIGDAPGGAETVEPTIEDAYLLILGDRALGAVA